MYQSTHSTQVFSMFGGGYVQERRSTDELPGNLAPSDIDEDQACSNSRRVASAGPSITDTEREKFSGITPIAGR